MKTTTALFFILLAMFLRGQLDPIGRWLADPIHLVILFLSGFIVAGLLVLIVLWAEEVLEQENNLEDDEA